MAMVLECINSWLFSHVKCSISLPASCILPTVLRSYTSALQRAANEASTRLTLHSVHCNCYNNADITRYWYVAGDDWQVRARTKYPGAGCSMSTTDFWLIEHWSWFYFTLVTCWSAYYLQTVSHHLENTLYLWASLPVWTHFSLSSTQMLACLQYKSPYQTSRYYKQLFLSRLFCVCTFY